MKVYLAGPMRGYPDRNIPAFHRATKLLQADGYTVFNPADLCYLTERDALATELHWLCLHAEHVFLLPGWQESRGALAEKAVAEALDIPCQLINTWGDTYYLYNLHEGDVDHAQTT